MYQIVFTSEFSKELSKSTFARARCAEPAEAALSSPPRTAPAGSARPAARFGLAQLAYGAALRALGAH
jgi:hypothetical protein